MPRYFNGFLIVLFFTTIQYNCSSKKVDSDEPQSGSKFFLELNDSLKIPIDDATNYKNNYAQFWEDAELKKQYYAILNGNTYKIQVYDLSTKELVYTYSVEKDGKYGIGKQMRGFYLKSFDSLYVASTMTCKVFLLNRNSEVIKSYSVCNESSNSHPSALTRAPMFMKDNLLFMSAHPWVKADGDFWTHELFLELNTISGAFRYYFKPPVKFRGKSWGVFHHHHGYTVNDKYEVVHNFTFDKDIYVRNVFDDSPIKAEAAPSRYFDEVLPWQTEPIDVTDDGDEEFYITSNSYKSILWDKWRKVYYRFAERGVELFDDEGLRRDWTDKKLSVIIIDEEFNVVGESEIPSNTYFIADSFVTKDGLHISTNHEKNPALQEDYFKFHVFKLSK
jgi:hypothetical protein